MRTRLIIVLSTVAMAIVGFAPAASAVCTQDPTGNVQCLESLVCGPLGALDRVGIEIYCMH